MKLAFCLYNSSPLILTAFCTLPTCQFILLSSPIESGWLPCPPAPAIAPAQGCCLPQRNLVTCLQLLFPSCICPHCPKWPSFFHMQGCSCLLLPGEACSVPVPTLTTLASSLHRCLFHTPVTTNSATESNRNGSSHSSESQESEIKVLAKLLPSRAPGEKPLGAFPGFFLVVAGRS